MGFHVSIGSVSLLFFTSPIPIPPECASTGPLPTCTYGCPAIKFSHVSYHYEHKTVVT